MQRGDIYWVNLGRGVGREFAGKHYVVVLSDSVTTMIEWTIAVVPAVDLSKEPRRKFGVRVLGNDSGLPTDLLFVPTEIRALDFSRFPKHPVGHVTVQALEEIAKELRRTLEISET